MLEPPRLRDELRSYISRLDRVVRALLEREREAENRGERRAQLVRDGGKDVVAHLLHAMPLGDVLRRPDQPERCAGRIDDDAAPPVDDALGPVVEHDAMLHLERLSRLERARDLARASSRSAG